MIGVNALGNQVAVDLYECETELNDIAFIREALKRAARAGKATIVAENFHQFAPQGVSGVLIIAESHIAVHTWPEFAYAAVDVFTCGTTVDAMSIKESLEKDLRAGRVTVEETKRGLIRAPVPKAYPKAESTS